LLAASTSSEHANGDGFRAARGEQTPPQTFSVGDISRAGAEQGRTDLNVDTIGAQPRPKRTPITQALGSMVPPDVTDNSAVKRGSETGYSYASAAPPPVSFSKAQELPPTSHTPISHSKLIKCFDVPRGWRPDPSLLPLNSFATLRDTLYQLALGRPYVVLVTGAHQYRQAKSRTATQLALALAETGHPRVLLVEADFDRPLVSRTLHIDMPPGFGFSQQLHARIRPDADPTWTVVRCYPTLDVIGETSVRTPGMLLSVQFETAITELRTHYDLIVIDAPATTLQMDIRALDSVVDGVVVAAQSGSDGIAQAERTLGLFGEKSLRAIVPTDASGAIL
jgi:Mrp family chromosome partitioning ATPase